MKLRKLKNLFFIFFFSPVLDSEKLKKKIIEEEVQAFINKKARAYRFKSYCKVIEEIGLNN